MIGIETSAAIFCRGLIEARWADQVQLARASHLHGIFCFGLIEAAAEVYGYSSRLASISRSGSLPGHWRVAPCVHEPFDFLENTPVLSLGSDRSDVHFVTSCYITSMSHTAKDVLLRIETSPQEDQEELAELAREIEARRSGIYVLDDQEEAAIREGLAELDCGEWVDEAAHQLYLSSPPREIR